MRSVQVLSSLALRRVLSRICQPVGGPEPGPLADDVLSQPGHHLARALRQANARAWLAIEVLLAGEAFWERAQLIWERDLELEFFRPIRGFLDGSSAASLDPPSCGKTWQVLDAARASGLLTSGGLVLDELLAATREIDDTEQARQAEWAGLGRLADDLEKTGYPELRSLFELRWGPDPLLVVVVSALFLHAVQADPDLFGDLTEACAIHAEDGTLEDFRGLAVVLDQHRSRLDALLRGIREPNEAQGVPLAIDTAGGASRVQRGQACAQRGEYEQAIGEFTAALQMDPSSAQAFVQRGDAHRLKGDFVQALSDYGTAIKLDPSNSLALLNRGQVHWMMMQGREAIADFTAVIQIEPQNAAAYHFRGKAYAAADDIDAAVSNFSEALRLDPYHAWAYHDCGDAYATRGAFDLAVSHYSEAIRLNPLATLSYLRRAEAYAGKKELERAIADYGNALRLDPHNLGAYLGRGTAYREQGLFDQAAADFTRALELDLSSPSSFFQRGLLFQAQGNHQRALLDFDAAIGMHADDAEFFYHRGLAHQQLGHEDKAITDLSQALRLNPDHAASYHERGAIFAGRGEADLAVADFSASVQLQPALPPAYVGRARAYSKLGQLELALADCDQALALDPQLAEAHLIRGSILAQDGLFDDAIEDLSRALRLDLNNPLAYFMRGVAHLKVDNPSQAVADLTEAIRLDPLYARAYSQRATIRKATGQHELALDDLAHAARIDSQFVAAYCSQLGLVHSTKGNFERAVADYTIAVMLDPENAAAQRARAQAWKAYLNRPRKTQVRPRRPQPVLDLAQAEPPITPSAGPTPGQPSGQPTPETVVTTLVPSTEATQQPGAAETPVPPMKDTGLHLKAETATDMPALGNGAAKAAPHQKQKAAVKGAVPKQAQRKKSAAPKEVAPAPEAEPLTAQKSVEIDWNVELQVEADSEPAQTSGEETAVHAKVETANHKAAGDSGAQAPTDESYQREQQLLAEKEKENARLQAGKSAKLVEQVRQAEAERQKKEAVRLAPKPKKKPQEEDDDDDERLPLWKKGMLVAASVLVLWLTGSAAWGWFFSPVRSMEPRAAVSGTAMGKSGQPLTGAWVSFHPKGQGGDVSGGSVDKKGKFSASVFPGSYVVTVGPDPESGLTAKSSPALTEIPAPFKDPKASPLTAEVSRQNTSFEFKIQ